jgi:long-chain acyl-CoA synthetase
MLVQEFLETSSVRLPDKVALLCDGKRLTYSEINAMANKMTNALVDRGVRRGDRVAIVLPNSVESVIAIFAILKAGCVFVVINNTTKENKLNFILNNCKAIALITEYKRYSQARTALSVVSSLKFCVLTGANASKHHHITGNHKDILQFDRLLKDYPDSPFPRKNIDLDLACLVYTSGSTGEPKGVMCDHSNVVFAADSIISYLKNVEDDIVINVLPLAFDYGLYQLLMTFRFGGTLVLERTFCYPAEFLKRIEAERVTGLPGVPTIFAMLLQMDLRSYDLTSLRYITNTAAALPPSHIQELRKKFPWATLYSMYGLTETKRTLYLPPDQLDKRPDSVGIAIPGTEVWIEDEVGNRLGPGEAGELVVRGRHVMRGYWDAPEATLERFRPGPIPGERLCYTGDLFRMDEDGYLYFVGRKDDMIKSRGEKVAPKEIENVIYGIDGVAEAAVIGVPDPILGQAIKAFIVRSQTSITEADVMAHCLANLEDFMVPKYVEFCDQLPKTSSGKIKKTDLK